MKYSGFNEPETAFQQILLLGVGDTGFEPVTSAV